MDLLLDFGRYEVPSAAQRDTGLFVSGVGRIPFKDSKHCTTDRVLGAYAAVYVTRGGGWFETAPSGRLSVRAGDLFWIFPRVSQSYAPHADETWSEHWVIFDGEMAKAYERQGFLTPERPLVHIGQDPQILEFFTGMQEAFERGGPLAVPRASALVHRLLVEVQGIASGLSDAPGAGANADAIVAEALTLIEREAVRGLTPEELAERLHVGYSTLRRRFRAATGYAVKEYMLGMRLKRAKALLVSTTHSVEDIARQTGFEDALYFSRMFKSRTGMPPSVFRERQLASHSATK